MRELLLDMKCTRVMRERTTAFTVSDITRPEVAISLLRPAWFEILGKGGFS